MDEKNLIEELKSGNQLAFKQLVEFYQKKIRNLCLSIVIFPEIADEIAQDVFIEVFLSIKKFRADSKLSTWMYRLAVNKSLNYLRSQKRHKVLVRIENLIFHEESSELQIQDKKNHNALEQLIKTEEEKRIETVLNSLTENQRIAFSLHKFEDMSYKEIAEIMSLSLSSVESLIHRAKINLQKKLLKH